MTTDLSPCDPSSEAGGHAGTSRAKEEVSSDILSRVRDTLTSFVGSEDPIMFTTAIHAKFEQTISTSPTASAVVAEPTPTASAPSPVQTAASQNSDSEFFKTSLCCFYSKGMVCPKGSACTYAHGVHELRTFKVSNKGKKERKTKKKKLKTFSFCCLTFFFSFSPSPPR